MDKIDFDIGDFEREVQVPVDEIEKTIPEQKEEDYLDNYNNQNPRKTYPNSQPVIFNDDSRSENLVMWELRVDWDRIEHIIRGHKPKIDENGNEYFVKIDNHYLNEYGVNSILHFLSFYLSKEIFLARYSKEEAQQRVNKFAETFIDFFYNNETEFGLDTKEKKKMSTMFVLSIIQLVDAAYSRAIEGSTAELINKQFSVMQSQPIENNYNPMNTQQNHKRGIISRMFG